MNATKDWFSAYKWSPQGPNTYIGHGFKDPYDAYGLSYQAIDFKEALVVPGGKNVAKGIQAVADSFGAHRVHLIGHSTGGLWNRAALVYELPNLAVHSITTVDTPHQGSYNADLRELVHHEVIKGRSSDLTFLQKRLDSTVYTPAIPDLTTWSAAKFNSINSPFLPYLTIVDGRANKVFYNSTASDANTDHSCEGNWSPCDKAHLPTISYYTGANQYDESEGYELPDPDYLKNAIVRVGSHFNPGEYLYRGVFQYQEATLTCTLRVNFTLHCKIGTVDNSTPQLNDFNVTLKSAQHPRFNQINPSYTYNHTMMDNSIVGLFVQETIKLQQQYVK